MSEALRPVGLPRRSRVILQEDNGMTRSDASSNDDRCARCGCYFHCGVNDERPCWCMSMQLDAATLAALAQRYRGCLCARCLAQVAAGDTMGA